MSDGIHFQKTVEKIRDFSQWLVCETIRSTLQDVDARVKANGKKQLTREQLEAVLNASVKTAVSHFSVLKEYQKHAVSCAAYFDDCKPGNAVLVPQSFHNAQMEHAEKWTRRLQSLLTNLIVPSSKGVKVDVATVRHHLQTLVQSGLCGKTEQNPKVGACLASTYARTARSSVETADLMEYEKKLLAFREYALKKYPKDSIVQATKLWNGTLTLYTKDAGASFSRKTKCMYYNPDYLKKRGKTQPERVMTILIHELAHTSSGPHDASFYKAQRQLLTIASEMMKLQIECRVCQTATDCTNVCPLCEWVDSKSREECGKEKTSTMSGDVNPLETKKLKLVKKKKSAKQKKKSVKQKKKRAKRSS